MEKGVFDVWVGNLGKYNEGKLIGEWVSLPCSQEKIDNLYKKIGINEEYSEVYIGDYSFPPDVSYLSNCCSEYAKVEDLNMIAALIEKYEPDVDAMQACMDNNLNLTLTEVGNMIAQADEILFYCYDFEGIKSADNLTNEEKYARTVTEENGLYQKLKELDVESYVNFDDMGRDYAVNNSAALYDNGYFYTAEGRLDLDYYSKEALLEMLELEESGKELQEELQKEETVPKI